MSRSAGSAIAGAEAFVAAGPAGLFCAAAVAASSIPAASAPRRERRDMQFIVPPRLSGIAKPTRNASDPCWLLNFGKIVVMVELYRPSCANAAHSGAPET